MSCSKKYNCFLPSPIIRGKNESKEQFIFKQKNFFKDNLQHKTSFFKGKPVFLTKRDEPGDACFNKFAIGKEEYHKTMQIDMRRVERLHWIFPIIENFLGCYILKSSLLYVSAQNLHHKHTIAMVSPHLAVFYTPLLPNQFPFDNQGVRLSIYGYL